MKSYQQSTLLHSPGFISVNKWCHQIHYSRENICTLILEMLKSASRISFKILSCLDDKFSVEQVTHDWCQHEQTYTKSSLRCHWPLMNIYENPCACIYQKPVIQTPAQHKAKAFWFMSTNCWGLGHHFKGKFSSLTILSLAARNSCNITPPTFIS